MTGIRPEHHEHDGYPPDWDARRRHVYRRDDFTCQHCGARGGPGVADGVVLHAHHETPKSVGGSHHPDNLLTLCADCHDRVHGRTPEREASPGVRSGLTPVRAGATARLRAVAAVVALLVVGTAVGVGVLASGGLPSPGSMAIPGPRHVSSALAGIGSAAPWLATVAEGWYGTTPLASVVPAGRLSVAVVGPAVVLSALAAVLLALASSGSR